MLASKIAFLSAGLLLSIPAFASTKCFLAKEQNTAVIQEGVCTTQASPCSTFKIAISLMGYNEGILIDETHPEWPFRQQLDTPTMWIQQSCVPYSQIITQKLGMKKFNDYVTKFHYGNQDLSGDKGANNGLTQAWLSSSLKISPEEQSLFLEKLLNNQLPVSLKAHEMTKNILFVEDLPNGWKLYGKTGSGALPMPDGSYDTTRQAGWFVGWIQKSNETIIFTHYIEDEVPQNTPAGPRAKAIAKEKLLTLIKQRGN